jgi:hypothetical protein
VRLWGGGRVVQEGHCRCFIDAWVDLDLLALSVHHVPPRRACSEGTSSQPKSCGNQECESAISYWAGGAAPVQACGNLPENDGRKSYAGYATYVDYAYLYGRATQCGLAASTVKLTPPALDTCDGAYTKYNILYT